MAGLGFNGNIPDKGLSNTVAPRVLTATFGDGYQQRLPDGINTAPKSFKLSFANRPKAEIQAIVTYLESLFGVTSFVFGYDKGDDLVTEIRVIAPTWNWTAGENSFHSLTVNLIQVFEP